MDNVMYVKVVDKNNKEYIVSADNLKIGNKTLKEIAVLLNTTIEEKKKLEETVNKQGKSLEQLSQKVEELKTFSEEN